MDAQARVLALYRSGLHAEALALQEGLDGGRLTRVRERAAALLAGGSGGAIPLFACGEYEPRRGPRRDPGSDPRSRYSESLLGLKALRTPGAFARRPGSAALCGALSARLARGLRRVARAGDLGRGARVLVAPVPGSKSGPPAFGLCRVIEGACALAGNGFAFRVLLLRGLDLPPAHLAGGSRSAARHLASLLPLLDREAGGNAVVLVDDVASSGATLRASTALVGLFNGVRTVGLALGRTRAALRDAGAVRLL